MKPIATCVVGMGKMGLRHMENLLSLPEYQVLAFSDPNYNGSCFNLMNYFDYHEMFDKVDAEAVFVCTPHHLHKEVCLEALKRGMYVFCEKPLAPTLQDCTEIKEAEKAGGRVAVGYHHMGLSNALYLKSFISAGLLGNILDVVVIVPWSRPNDYYERSSWAGKMQVDKHWCLDGVLMNQMSHFINQAMWFASTSHGCELEPPIEVSIDCKLYKVHDTPALEADDLAIMRCTLGTGTRLFCVGTTALDVGDKETIEVIGKSGRALYDGKVTIWPRKESILHCNAVDEPYYMYRNFESMVRREMPPYSSANEATKTTHVLFGSYLSADFEVKPISKSDVGDLKSLMYKAAQYRSLFHELPNPPAWS